MKKKKIFLYLHLIFFYAILVTGSTYAYLNISNSSNNTVTGAVGCFGVNYEGEEIKHTNLSSTTNYLEGVKSTVTLSKADNCDIYTEAYIYIHVNDNITAPIVSVEAVRYKVMQGNTEISSGFINTKGDVLLATVPLTTTSTSYNIYIWVDSSLSNKEYDNVTFTGYIYATSEQTSTVGSDKLYNIVKEGAVMDNTSSTYVSSSSGIDFTQNNSNTNGKGVYIRSGTENKAYPIYYYRGDINNNNVIFANTCFKMVRTTDKGGIKLIYNGVPSSGQCNNTGTATQIGIKEFNTNTDSPVYVGYMYGTRYAYSYTNGTGWYYAPDVTYAGGTYTLASKGSYSVETKSTIDVTNLSYHHYTCGSSTSTTCTSVRYVFSSLREGSSNVFYITLTNGKKIKDALSDMFDNNTTSSTIKGNSTTSGTVDYWYYNNIENVNDSMGNSYSTYIEDTVYCNDRSFNNYSESGWNPDGGSIRTYLNFGVYGRVNNPSVTCPRTVDRFTKSSSLGNGALDYPVGLLTADEMRMAGGSSSDNSSYYLYTSQRWWSASPSRIGLGTPNIFGNLDNVNLNGILVINSYGVRPVITLLNNTRISGGTGTSDDPYLVLEGNAAQQSNRETVYTVNIYDENDEENTLVWLNQAIPNAITKHTTVTSARNAFSNNPFYLKHILENNLVKESYVEFIVTPEMASANPGMTAGTYALRGYTDGTYYSSNVNVLKQAFGENSGYCSDFTSSSYVGCGVSGFHANASSDGYVTATGGSASCGVDYDGGSVCVE